MPDHMPPEVEKRIRALPGNSTCCDCNNLNPQWASVSYGALVCLECSGQHRSLGVHLSFVRSIQMDSWNDRQLQAMELSGGNKPLVDYFESRGIAKSMRVATKYDTKQAAYYRERLTRRLDGKTEPPPDPGRYDPATGGSEAQGAEPLPGETTDQYNARQAKLREDAKERLRQKFGGSSMGGVGSQSNVASGGFGSGGDEEGLGGVFGSAASFMGGAATGALDFFKDKVLENEDLRGSLRTSVSKVGDIASGALGSVRQTVAEGEVLAALKRNATFEEGSSLRNVAGWTTHTATDVWTKGSSGIGDLFADGGEYGAPQAPRCSQGHTLCAEPQGAVPCSLCRAKGTRYACSKGCEYSICCKCFEKPPSGQANGSAKGKKDTSFDFDDDEWGHDAPPPNDPTPEEMDRLAKEMGMKLASDAPQPTAMPSPSGDSPQRKASGTVGAASLVPAVSPSKEEKKGLAEPDDFFGEFGM